MFEWDYDKRFCILQCFKQVFLQYAGIEGFNILIDEKISTFIFIAKPEGPFHWFSNVTIVTQSHVVESRILGNVKMSTNEEKYSNPIRTWMMTLNFFYFFFLYSGSSNPFLIPTFLLFLLCRAQLSYISGLKK